MHFRFEVDDNNEIMVGGLLWPFLTPHALMDGGCILKKSIMWIAITHQYDYHLQTFYISKLRCKSLSEEFPFLACKSHKPSRSSSVLTTKLGNVNQSHLNTCNV